MSWWLYLLLTIRVLLLSYVIFLLAQCALHALIRKKRLDRRNGLIYLLVIISFLLAALHISNNIWANVAGQSNSESSCKTWRGASIILYVLCLIPVSVLLWVRQNFFYQLNMIKRTSSPLLLVLSRYIIYPMGILFSSLVIFFIVLYSPRMDIMDYKVDQNGFCKSGKSRGFSSVFMGVGDLMIVSLHFILLYLFINPLRNNMASQANNAGIMSVRRKDQPSEEAGLRCPSAGSNFKSIKDIDRALIRKLAMVTGLVIGTDIVCLLSYVIMKYSGVDLMTQSVMFDLQVTIASLSNVLCWKHWREILLPDYRKCGSSPKGSTSSARARHRTTSSICQKSFLRLKNLGPSASNSASSIQPIMG